MFFPESGVLTHLNCNCASLKVGAVVEAKNPDGQYMEGMITKLTDASIYTVGKEAFFLV